MLADVRGLREIVEREFFGQMLAHEFLHAPHAFTLLHLRMRGILKQDRLK